MDSIEELLSTLHPGDFVHANYPWRADAVGSAICLVIEIDDKMICTRSVTTQLSWLFDKRTGVGNRGSQLDSVAPLPFDVQEVLRELDRRYCKTPSDARLRRSEIDALMFAGEFYRTNPISVHVQNLDFCTPKSNALDR